ncbi:gtp-binding protein beta subunit-like protein [Fusarium austroafricanum]|uniref:Gtp-binding protein beta subunit-like protein n=1 Tax=Fusarium austroafricanum TaxID=2364996 RepID=A0A8H4KMP5_9HYPO|nr:gtp-binding protein beta subunit-like protein [Fusarium austroafricanum]
MAAALFPRLSSPALLSSVSFRQFTQKLLPSLSIAIPGVSLNLPTIDDIWESVLRAVPKNKVSHSRKRHRQMAGKALKDVNNLCKCPGCGQPKRTHRLCQTCLEEMKQIWPHITDIFSIATTPKAVISGSGSSTLHIHDTTDSSFPLKQSISDAHKLGCHHVCTSRNGNVAASAGFGGEVKVWKVDIDTGEWSLSGEITGPSSKPGEAWAMSLSEDGSYLATTTNDGRVNVWHVADEKKAKIREYETGSAGSGSFGMSVDLSRDGKYTASGHQNGSVYIFNNDTGRVLYSLSGLAKPVRSVAFSPGNTRLAAAGDAGIIALYDMKHGEHVGNLTGHSSWITSLDWSDTGEYLLSGSMDGKVKSHLASETDPTMPATRRSVANTRRGPPTKGQSTLSFSNKVTKPVPKNAKKSVISASVTKVDPSQHVKQGEIEGIATNEPERIELDKEEVEPEVESEVVPEPEKSESELRAGKITDAQIKKYWKSIENQWTTPRLHQQGVSMSEQVLRYFDVSSQYGPCIGISRMKRWKRAERLGLNPPVEVLAVLLKEESKGKHSIETAHMDEILNSTVVGA